MTRSRRPHTATRSADRTFRVAEALLVREADGRAFRLIGIGAYDLVADGRAPQAGLFDAGAGEEDLDDVLDELRDRFGDEAIVRGRGKAPRRWSERQARPLIGTPAAARAQVPRQEYVSKLFTGLSPLDV